MHPGDAFDLVVQRYGGFVLLFVGVLALVTAAAGYHRYLPPPFSAPIFRPSCIGCRQLTELSRLLVDLGIFCLVVGPVAMPHNRRNRDAARRSA